MAVHHLASMSSAIDDKPHVIVVINTSPALPRGPGPVSVPADADQRLSNDANQCALKLQVSGMITDLTTHHCTYLFELGLRLLNRRPATSAHSR